MKLSEMRDKDPTQLKSRLLELRREQLQLEMQRATGELAKTDGLRSLRRDVARIKTILAEKRRQHGGEA